MSLAFVLSLLSRRNGSLRFVRPVTAAGIICASALAGNVAWANQSATDEVAQLLKQGQVNEAARRAQNYLKQNADDVPMRFLQGVIAAEQRKYDQAIQIFTSLSKDYPSLPEPYNNLAVLYAAKGEERKAAQVLEQAIRTNPSYATAHENLGDLYARMASDAYAKALQLDGSRQAVQPKLSLIKQIFTTQTQIAAAADKATSATTRNTPAVTAAASTAPATVVAAPQPTEAEKPATAAPATVVAAAPSAPSSVNTKPAAPAAEREPEPEAKPAPQPAKEPAKPNESKLAAAAVEKAVAAWAKAWEQQNMSAYYAAYSNNFEPTSGSLAAWKTERKERIVGKPSITLEVRNLKVDVQGTRATANFRQYYASGGYKATTRKTLSMRQEGGKWLITREDTGR